MNCIPVRPLLPLHPDPDEPPATREAVEAHLKACNACSKEWLRVRNAWNLLDALPSPVPDAGFAARVRERIRLQPSAPRLLRLPRAAAAVAAALLLAVPAFILLRRPEASNPSGPPAPDAVAADTLPPAEIEIVQNLDLLQDFEIAETLDVLAADTPLDDADAVLELLPREY
jgi:predicted anti-sigma-YlaC factor YlaD